MTKSIVAVAAVLLSLTTQVHADDMITKTSKHSYKQTQAKLETALKKHKMRLFTKINHTAGANKIGLRMQPETLFIFGNPKGGTPFMVAQPTAAIDLPMKALVWQDKDGKVQVTYNTADYLVHRHNIGGMDEAAKKIDSVLDRITNEATQ